jgi:ATP phosphoribosyltransferase regulatory subunit
VNGTPHTLVQVPPGVQCFVGAEARRRRAIEDRVIAVFEGWDYEEIIPPLFDYADAFSEPALAPKTYSFVGRDGSLLALRPDFTSLLAKIAAGRLSERPAPLRLYYSGEVLRYEPPRAGRQSELYQMGLEHLGGDRQAADAEVLAIAAECLGQLGVRGFVLALGHMGVFAGLSEAAQLTPAAREALRERVDAKDAAGVRESLAGSRSGGPAADALARLPTLAGDAAVLEEAERTLAFCPAAAAAVRELRATVAALAAAGLAAHLKIDLGAVKGLGYHTGLLFRAYAPDLGFEVGGGGRYDTLLGRFGRPMPAVGFMLGLDRLALLLDRQGAVPQPPPPDARSVRDAELGAALAQARSLRATGTRVRLEAAAAGSPANAARP